MFIAGEPMKPATNSVHRAVVEIERAAGLLDDAVAHHDDLVGHRHRLDLVVRDVDRRRLEALVQLLDLGAHLHAQLGVEVGQRLVEQEHLRVAHDRAAHRHALPLAAGELRADSGRDRAQGRGCRRPSARARRCLPSSRFASISANDHVVAHRHVRIERVVLEHHRDVALLRRNAIDDRAADRDFAGADLLQAGDHPQAASTCRTRRARPARRTRRRRSRCRRRG